MPLEGEKQEDVSPVKHRSMPKLGLVIAAIIAICAIVIGIKTISAGANTNEYKGFIQSIEEYK